MLNLPHPASQNLNPLKSARKSLSKNQQANLLLASASNIKKGIIDVGSVPIRTAANGARIQWDGTNGLVQYDSKGNPVSWLDLKGNSRFVNAYLSGEIHAKRGVLGDGNVIIDDKGVRIVRPDGAITMQNGLMHNAYAVSADDPYYMTTTKNEVPGDGTAPASPIFELEVLKPVTFAMVQNQFEEYQLIGTPLEADMETVDTRKLLIEERGETLDTWSNTPTKVDGGVVAGRLSTDNDGITVPSYGPDTNNWHGPALIKEISPCRPRCTSWDDRSTNHGFVSNDVQSRNRSRSGRNSHDHSSQEN